MMNVKMNFVVVKSVIKIMFGFFVINDVRNYWYVNLIIDVLDCVGKIVYLFVKDVIGKN